MSSVALAQPTIESLAQIIRREHESVRRSVVVSFQHAIVAGEALLQAKELVAEGEWTFWLEELGVAPKTARTYMRLAYYKDELYESGNVNITRARIYLRDLPAIASHNPNPLHVERAREARRLRGLGLTQQEIAERLGSSQSQVSWWLKSPRARAAYFRNRRTRLARQRALLEIESRRSNIKEAAKSNGAGRAYSYLRRAAQELQALADEGEGIERREAAQALMAIYKAEDALGRALRVPGEYSTSALREITKEMRAVDD